MEEFIYKGTISVMIFEGDDAIKILRTMQGNKNIKGTIRGDFSVKDSPSFENALHASDSIEEAEREIKIWLTKGQIIDINNDCVNTEDSPV